MKNINCGICKKKLTFWNQPVFAKGDLKSGEKICSSCFMKINNKSPKTATHLMDITLSEAINIVEVTLKTRNIENPKKESPLRIDKKDPNDKSHLSEKLLRILKSKTHLSSQELNNITEAEGWSIVYSLNQPKEKLSEICFTGFTPSEKEELIEISKKNDLQVVKSVTRNLSFLCVGDEPGPSKMEKAKNQKVNIITKNEFINLVTTGELPRK